VASIALLDGVMKWVGHQWHKKEVTNAKKYFSREKWGGGRNSSADLGTDEKQISERILKKYGVKVWTGFTWLKIPPNGMLL
jgi:hypothetical protein